MTSSQSRLQFVETTRKAFNFVIMFGLKEVAAEETIVRYASDKVELNVYHGRSSREIALEFRKRASPEQPWFSMSALVRARNPTLELGRRNRIATTAGEVRTAVNELAEELRVYGGRALEGDDEFYAQLKEQQRVWAEGYAAEVAYDQVLPRADAAFRDGDYATASELYEDIRGRLSPAELKKLEYARKHK